ncbi:PREDICTED: calcium-transporting ATPase 8, plasma membrane-type-like isoform X2 [Tarenaya hassleriana]|uniref:calcium-transporting ATPase 8, plasma membrane-type-like isoform X2 n=1 Tax=Tarenaya hassleriana TaxID=28532 RepID=UPI00053C4AEA|nr:PREDICTED: calcium-transporting ATPase 8, plasma membrane-type-like isoform X2 [Tarenaya hassleriana]XP_019059476.1 PREDICTED: calcium-transporting ATPase 8, plasma membrane-type-like isoform X2 [Tarenaya hassleriana]
MIAAEASLVLRIKTEGIKEGWYGGGSIAFAVVLVVTVTSIMVVENDASKGPFLMSCCKVADDKGIIPVTVVGIGTEWGLLMACISKENGEETPVHVCLNGVADF